MQKRYKWCSIHEDGYPVIRESSGRRFAAAAPATPTMKLTAATPVKIKPMKLLSAAEVEPKAPGSKPLPLTAKLKPTPSVPAAPEGLPSEFEFCVQQSDDGTRFLRYRDPKHRNHGMDVTESSECFVDANGSTWCHSDSWKAPVCEQPEADKEPLPRGCCFDIETSTLVCPGSAYDGLVVTFIEGSEHEIGGVAHVSVKHPDLPGGGARPAVCVDVVPPQVGTVDIPTDRPRPEDVEPECCVEISSSTLQQCKDPSLNGTPVEIFGAPGPKGILVHIPSHNWKGYLPVCAQIATFDPTPPPTHERPDEPECCVDLNTSTLQNCLDPSLNGTPVNIKGAPGPQGVLVGVPSLNWKGYLPVCATLVPEDIPPPETVPDICCYDPATSSLVCEGTAFHGLVVELVTMGKLADGTEIASVQHEQLPGGGMRLIICTPPPTVVEIPPDIPDIPPGEIPPEIDDKEFPEPEPRPIPPTKIPKPPVMEPVPNLPPPSPGLPPHCCYSYAQSTLECAGSELNGMKVRLVMEGAVKDGWPMVKVEHPRLPGGYAVVPVCVTDCMGASRQILDRAAAERSSEGQPTYLERWTKMALGISQASDMECPGRRFSATRGQLGVALGDGCIGGTGISDRFKEYAPLPGLRGWQRNFEG